MMKTFRRLIRHWLTILNLFWVVYAGLPWLAPLLMHVGADGAGRVIYTLYRTQCHQMAQRSLFLFGQQPMYSLAELQAVWPGAIGLEGLRAVIGNEEMGWKVAWSERMVTMYAATFVFGLLFALVRQRLRPIPVWLFILLLLPMALDGGTHLVSDLSGVGRGFRETNAWLSELTGNRLPASFYAGDALGSFNSWLRLLTGGLFGLGLVGFLYPRLEAVFRTWATEIDSGGE